MKIYKEFQVFRHRHDDGIALGFVFPAHLGSADGFQPRFGMKEDAIVIVQRFDLFQDLLAFCGGFLIQERAERMLKLPRVGIELLQKAGIANSQIFFLIPHLSIETIDEPFRALDGGIMFRDRAITEFSDLPNLV